MWIKVKFVCTDEINFYIKNKSFPINEYLNNELLNNENIKIPPPHDATTISDIYPARIIFLTFVVPATANKETNSEFLFPLNIVEGRMAEPSCGKSYAILVPPPVPISDPTYSNPNFYNKNTVPSRCADSSMM